MKKALLEVCVDSYASLLAANKGGADRIELCAALSEGGITPNAGFIQAAVQTGAEIHVMIRPRGGDFCYSPAEVEIMRADIEHAKSLGVAGIVLGATKPNGELDVEVLTQLLKSADGLITTLHRAIDLAPDHVAAVEQAEALGFSRILTSGGAKAAQAGAEVIKKMVVKADDQIEIMPGSGVNVGNARDILDVTGANSIHASCSEWVRSEAGLAESMGLASEQGVRQTSQKIVAELKQSLVEAEMGGAHV